MKLNMTAIYLTTEGADLEDAKEKKYMLLCRKLSRQTKYGHDRDAKENDKYQTECVLYVVITGV